MNLLFTIKDNYYALQSDFLGLSIHPSGILNFFQSLLIACGIVLLYYLFGQKVRKRFFPQSKEYNLFINIVLGYGIIGSIIAMLGIFSLLHESILTLVLTIIIFISLFPFQIKKRRIIYNYLTSIKRHTRFRLDFMSIGIILICSLVFLRLITPEITEDAYHTDLPVLYLSSQTTMHENKHPLQVITYPQLAEMTYIIPIFLGQKEATRFIHYIFFVLIVVLIVRYAQREETSYAKYAPLLFVTAPVVIRYAPSQYIDFFMVFSFLLSVILITSSRVTMNVLLAGIILGAALATKLWVLIYLPAFIVFIYFYTKNTIWSHKFKLSGIFLFGVVLFPSIWYIRTFLLTKNPVYPVFAKIDSLELSQSASAPLSNYLGFNWNMFSIENMIVLSPLFFLSVLFLLLYLKPLFLKLRKINFYLFFLLLMIEQLFVKVDLGRYLIAWYSVVVIIVSAGIFYALEAKFFRVIFILLYAVFFSYYAINTLLVLPYGFGWADKNNYLTRVLGKDNASYYDFDHQFGKHLGDQDLVATYGIFGYYYADFNYLDVNYIFSNNDRSSLNMKNKKVTKLLIKGGDFIWFCKQLKLLDCDKISVDQLVSYQAQSNKYTLYRIK